MIIIYQVELYKNNKIEYNLDDIIKDNVDIENEFVKDMVYGTTTYVDKIDELANKHLNNWSIDRLDSMGRAILRMSIYEMLYMDTPDLVVINEAMELAKKYADDSVRKMINAVLDSLINEQDESSTGETEEDNTHIILKFNYNGEKITTEADGNGPVDAVKLAIKQTVPELDYAIEDYTEHALSSGSHAKAAAYIQIKDNRTGNTTHGVGVSGNITKASIRAVFSALNRMKGI